jgi:hypothetical protein
LATPNELLDQLACTPHRLHFVDQLAVERSLIIAHGLSPLGLESIAGKRRYKLIASHPDVAMDAPNRQDQIVLTKGAVPSDRVLVVGVDERAVYIEDRGPHQEPL